MSFDFVPEQASYPTGPYLVNIQRGLEPQEAALQELQSLAGKETYDSDSDLEASSADEDSDGDGMA